MFRRVLLTIAILLVLNVSLVCAESFHNAPEDAAIVPNGGWETSYPDYQRNVLIDFATSPETWQLDPEGPAGSRDLVPDVNASMTGTDDPTLFRSDWISWGGDMTWVDTHPVAPGRQGMIGVADQPGGWAFDLTLHLDNWDRPNKYKHIWIEMDLFISQDALGAVPVTLVTPTESAGFDQVEDLGGGWMRQNYWLLIEPNPPWEELQISFVGHPLNDGTVLIDNVHVATECVPEPTTLVSLLGLGLVGLVAWRRRKRTS